MKSTSSSKPTNRKNIKSVILPGCTELYQPNRVTYSKGKRKRDGGFTLMQSRILITIIKELQEAILASMNGKDWQALPVYFSKEHNMVRVAIRLKDIAKPYQYKEVYEAALDLGTASIRLPSSISKEYYCIATLLPRVELPKIVEGNSIMYVELFKDAARKIIEIDRTNNDRPGYFTRYLYEVAMSAKNKYTYKLYMIIASWKQKGGFRISVEDLKLQLGIPDDDYPEYKEFKRRVLLPVQKDLEGKSDCWFNCAAAGFEEKSARKVASLNFKIIVPVASEILQNRMDYILHLLRTHFSFNEEHARLISPSLQKILCLEEPYPLLLEKLASLQAYIKQCASSEKRIFHVPPYVLKAVLEWIDNIP